MGLIRYNGGLLNRNGSLASSTNCCCDCNCCGADPETVELTDVSLEWVSPKYGNSTGALVADSWSYSASASQDNSCVGRFDFTMLYENGACQANANGAAYAQLYHFYDENTQENCCYWEVYFTEEPDAQCGGSTDPTENLRDGWPGPGPALVLSCGGGNVPSSCPIQGSCIPFCDDGGFSFVSYITNLAGNCFCPGDIGVI